MGEGILATVEGMAVVKYQGFGLEQQQPRSRKILIDFEAAAKETDGFFRQKSVKTLVELIKANEQAATMQPGVI